MNKKVIRGLASIAFLSNLYLLGLYSGYTKRIDCANPFEIYGGNRYLVDTHLWLTLLLLVYVTSLKVKSKLTAILSTGALAGILFVYLRGFVLIIHNDEISFLDNLRNTPHPLDALSLLAAVALTICHCLMVFRNSEEGG